MTHASILDQILNRVTELQASGRISLCVFDLDSTLFNVTGRNRRIIRAFAALEHVQEKYPEQAALLNRARFQETDWGIREALMREGLQGTPEFFLEIREFWSQHFFSNNYLGEDRPYDGAVEYVQELHQAGCQIAYLTGRDEPRMGQGTRNSLKYWKFPDESKGCRLILKPHQKLDDAEFKAQVIQTLAEPENEFEEENANGNKFDSIWFFENEPINIYFVAKHIPSVQIIFFDSTHSRRAEPPLHLPTIQSYRR